MLSEEAANLVSCFSPVVLLTDFRAVCFYTELAFESAEQKEDEIKRREGKHFSARYGSTTFWIPLDTLRPNRRREASTSLSCWSDRRKEELHENAAGLLRRVCPSRPTCDINVKTRPLKPVRRRTYMAMVPFFRVAGGRKERKSFQNSPVLCDVFFLQTLSTGLAQNKYRRPLNGKASEPPTSGDWIYAFFLSASAAPSALIRRIGCGMCRRPVPVF